MPYGMSSVGTELAFVSFFSRFFSNIKQNNMYCYILSHFTRVRLELSIDILWMPTCTHSPRHVENPFGHNKSNPEEKVTGRNEWKHQKQDSNQHLPALSSLQRAKRGEKRIQKTNTDCSEAHVVWGPSHQGHCYTFRRWHYTYRLRSES